MKIYTFTHSLNSDVATAQKAKLNKNVVLFNKILKTKKINETIIYSVDPAMSGKETANMYRICTSTKTNVRLPT
jgi:hypothetical protein